jgi:UDP-glucuronate decarboxylase
MDHKDTYPLPINIGNPGEFTILELAEKIIQMTGTTSKIVFQDLPQDDPKQRRPDISRAKTVLSWEPKINLEQGLIKTIDYFRNIV